MNGKGKERHDDGRELLAIAFAIGQKGQMFARTKKTKLAMQENRLKYYR